MNDFVKVSPMSNFKPVFVDGAWRFQSLTTSNLFSLDDMLDDRHPNNKSNYEHYVERARQYSTYEMFSHFVVYWVEQVLMSNAFYYAENAYQEYLSNNLTGAKKAGKVYQAADKEYQLAFDKHMNKFMEH